MSVWTVKRRSPIPRVCVYPFQVSCEEIEDLLAGFYEAPYDSQDEDVWVYKTIKQAFLTAPRRQEDIWPYLKSMMLYIVEHSERRVGHISEKKWALRFIDMCERVPVEDLPFCLDSNVCWVNSVVRWRLKIGR